MTETSIGIPTGEEADYEKLADGFRPIFARIAEGAVERETDRALPYDQVRWLTEARFGALRVPAEFGGFGASYHQFIRLLTELAEADSNVAHLFRSHAGFVETLASKEGDAQAYWYGRIAAGEIAGNAATERTGNQLGEVHTTVTPNDGGWVVNGTKYYTTGSIFADLIQVTVQVPGNGNRHHAIVSTRQPGVRISDDWDGFGQQLTGTGTTVFTDAAVEPFGLFERDGANTLEPALFQLVLLAVQAGIGRAILADVTDELRKRTRNFNTGSGVPMRDEPLIQQVIGNISAKVYAAEQVVLGAARELDHAASGPSTDGQEGWVRAELAVQKAHIIVPGLVVDAAGQLFDALGASATSRSKKMDRHWRNARTVATHNPAVYKARSVGDFEINGTPPVGLTAIGVVGPRS